MPNARWVATRLLNADEAVSEAVRSGELGLLGQESPAWAESPESERERILDTARTLRWDLSPDFHDAIMERTFAAAQE